MSPAMLRYRTRIEFMFWDQYHIWRVCSTTPPFYNQRFSVRSIINDHPIDLTIVEQQCCFKIGGALVSKERGRVSVADADEVRNTWI